MFIEGCVKGVVLLLLVGSSFSRSLDDSSRTLDAAVENPLRNFTQHRSLGGDGGSLRRWNPALEDSAEQNRNTSIGDQQRTGEDDLQGVNSTSDVKESKDRFGFLPLPYGQCLPQYVFQVGATTAAPTTIATSIIFNSAAICQQLSTNAGITGPTALQTFLQQCAGLLSLISAPTTVAPTTTAAPTLTPPVSSTCQFLASNAGITTHAALQTFLQQCALLLGLISAPTTTAPTTTVVPTITAPTTSAAPTITPPVSSTCQFLAANAGITTPAALQTFLQQCAVLLGLISAPTTTAPTTTVVPTTAAPTITAPTTTAAPTVTPPVSSTCQFLAASSGITAPAALQTFLQQCAVLLGVITG